jgi:adenylate cyclase class IV
MSKTTATNIAVTSELQRHHAGSHIENELRYYRPHDFEAGDELAGLVRASTQTNPHIDHYFDAASPTGPLLRAAACSLRLRVKPNGEVLATFKRKLADVGARALREEHEQAVGLGASTHVSEAELTDIVEFTDADVLTRARTMVAAAPLQRMFAITNERIDHHYRSASTHIVLSEDHLTFSDGSFERRIEVELVKGEADFLERVHALLCQRYSDLCVCKRGKLSEGRRRHAALLGF